MKKTGILLKEARENKGLSIHEASLTLKINSKILRAIEEGDSENLPAKTFLRGFVKSYSTYLKLNPDKVLELFYEEMGTTNPTFKKNNEVLPEPATEVSNAGSGTSSSSISGTEEPVPAPVPVQKETNTPYTESAPLALNKKSFFALFLILSIVLIIFMVKKTINKYEKESDISTASIEKMNEDISKPKSLEKMEGAQSSERNMSKDESLSEKDIPSHENAPITKINPQETPLPKATPSSSASPKPETNDIKTPQTPPPNPLPNAGHTVEVIVEALDGVEIDYSTITGSPSRLSLKAEQVHTFKSKNGLVLNISNGGAINLFVNGKEVGIPGT